MSLSSFVSLSFPFKRRKERVELSKGRYVLKTVIDALMASKGDTILVIPKWFIILVNIPWQKFSDAFRALDARAQKVVEVNFVVDILKVNEERHYALARLVEGTVVAEFNRSEVVEEVIEEGREAEARVIEGVEFRISRIARHKYQIHGIATLKFFSDGSWRIYEEVRGRAKLSVGIDEGVEWRIVGDGRLSNILSRYLEKARSLSRKFYGKATVFTEDGIAHVDVSSDGVEARVSNIGLPPTDALLRCSRFYTVIVPRLFMESFTGEYGVRKDVYAEFEVYHGGKKRLLVFNSEPPDTIWFRVLRRRSISSYLKKVLPRGYESARDIIKEVSVPEWAFFYYIVRDPSEEKVTKVLRRFNEFIQHIDARIQNIRAKPRNKNGVEGFFEAIYARIPRRKLRIVKEWLELYEKVKDLAPKTTLYVVFYGQRARRRLPNFAGFRIDVDEGISVLSRRAVPISGIAFRGGAFESAYRDVMNLDNLIFYQLARREEKLAILRDWVEEVRGRLVSSGVAPATATFKEVAKKIAEVAESEDLTDNGILLVFRFLRSMRERASQDVLSKVEGLAKYLVGLVKSGRYPDDYVKFAERGYLEPMRWVIKWAIKSRGYSIRKGVLILGDPIEVRRKVREVIQRMRGRLLALAESLDLEVVSREAWESVETSRRRLEALLKVI